MKDTREVMCDRLNGMHTGCRVIDTRPREEMAMYMKGVYEWSGGDVHDLITPLRAAVNAASEKSSNHWDIEYNLREVFEGILAETCSRSPTLLAYNFTYEQIATDPAGRTLWLDKAGCDIWVEDWLGDIRKGLASETPLTEVEHAYWLHHLNLLEEVGVDLGDLRDRVTSCVIAE